MNFRASVGRDGTVIISTPSALRIASAATGISPATEHQIARILASWENALSLYGGKEGFLFGKFSIADCMYAPVVSRFTTFNVAVSKPVKDYMARIWALPGMQAWLKDSQKEVADGIA